MLNFRSQSNVPNYLGRAYQRRLLYLVGGLVLVVFLMSEARKPGNWSWYKTITGEHEEEVDTIARGSPKPPRVPGAFVVKPPKKRPVRYDPSVPLQDRVRPELLRTLKDNEKFTPADREPFDHLMQILQDTDAATIRAAPAERTSYVQLWSQSPQYRGKLVTVSGRVRGVRLKKAWSFAFELPSGPEDELNAGRVPGSLRQAFEEKERPLRGDISVSVVVAGRQWQIDTETDRYLVQKTPARDAEEPKDAEKPNDAKLNIYEPSGIGQYYEVWLQHDGTSNTSNPIAIFCLELPESFPVSMKIDERAEITGFYYRRWWYLAGDRPRVAPLVLAKTLDWRPAAAAAEGGGTTEFSMPLLIGLVVAAALIALVVVIYLFNRGGSDELPDYVRRHMKGADAESFDETKLGLRMKESMEEPEEGHRNPEPGPSGR